MDAGHCALPWMYAASERRATGRFMTMVLRAFGQDKRVGAGAGKTRKGSAVLTGASPSSVGAHRAFVGSLFFGKLMRGLPLHSFQ